MSSITQEQLLKFFREAAGTNVPEPSHEAALESSDAPRSASETQDGLTYAATPVGTSTEAGVEKDQSSGGAGSTIESELTTFLEGGLGIVPLVSSLFGLFGGGSAAPPELEKYEKPSSIDFVSADTTNGLVAADYDQLGMPRLADTAVAGPPTPSLPGGGSSTEPYGNSVSQPATATPQITVSVQAMDAQSILDRSNDIAQAVRSAMLSMNTINDVISDL